MKIHNTKQTFQRITAVAGLSAFLLLSVFVQTASSQPIQKKLIELGWDKPDTSTLRKNLAQMEKTPFDGVVINVTGKTEKGEIVSIRNAFDNRAWKKEWFQSSLDDLRAIHSEKLTDNFVQLSANPGSVDWFDDAGWKQIVDHWRIAAWIAKEGNLKGIMFDAEPYVKPYRVFSYASQLQKDKYSFEEYQDKIRERGREIIQAVASVDPNLVIFTTRMNSDNVGPAESPFPQLALHPTTYLNLYPFFINGWMDVAPPTMIFVEGTEDQGYRANSEFDFLKAGNDMRNTILSLVAPENRQKYKAQVQVSFGIYLDAYTNPPTSGWYMDPKGFTPTQRLQTNVSYAANVADEYVWIYGEKYRWWPTDNKYVKPQYWGDVLPEIHDALMSSTHPQMHWLANQKIAELQKNDKLVNLLQNGDFSAGKSNTTPAKDTPDDWKSVGAPAHWSTWQASVSHGTFAQDNSVNHDNSKGGAARLAGIDTGAFIQKIDVKPGELYVVRAWTRQIGKGMGSISIRWQTADGKWTDLLSDAKVHGPKNANDSKWHMMTDIVRVPDNAGKLVVLLFAGGQLTNQDIIWFDDIGVYKISEEI